MQVLPASFQGDSASKMALWDEVFQSSSMLCLDGRIATLQGLISSLSESEKDSELYGRVKQSLRMAQGKKFEVDVRLALQADFFLKTLGESLPLCIEYAVLDSRMEVPRSYQGFSEGMAIQFFLTMLHHFDDKDYCGEISQLKRALEHFFELWLFQEDYRFPRFDRLDDAGLLFHHKVSGLLKSLQQGMPYMFFPLTSINHAMVGKVTWDCEEGFSLTIVNKGDAAQFLWLDSSADLVYRGLSEVEVHSAIMANINVTYLTYIIYDNIERALPVEKRHRFMGRRHGLHKRFSCSFKSLTEAMHGVLTPWIYRDFKVFYTNRLVREMEPGVAYNAACQVLTKRVNKSL